MPRRTAKFEEVRIQGQEEVMSVIMSGSAYLRRLLPWRAGSVDCRCLCVLTAKAHDTSMKDYVSDMHGYLAGTVEPF